MPRIHQAIPTGTTFGEWTVLKEDIHTPGKNGLEYRYLARCSCGTERVVSCHSLRRGRSQSCGCRRVELFVARNTKHGHHNSKTYAIWEAMLDRCRNPSSASYADYGGRGITVCSEWYQFEAFFRDMGEKPPSLSLDRIDNSRGYESANCRWADAKTQTRNTRRNRFVILSGETMCATDAARRLCIDPPSLWERVKKKSETMQQAVDYFAAKRGHQPNSLPG